MLLDGRIAAAAAKQLIKEETALLVGQYKITPHLAAILVGNNGASETYVASKVKNCEEVGFTSTLIRLEDTVSENELLATIQKLNSDAEINGILVQLPLPKHISEANIIEAIHPSKDVDGFHPMNVGRLVQGLDTFIPATPYGILLMLEHFKIPSKGKHTVVIGRSNIVGRPMSILMSSNIPFGNSTVTLCHSQTADLASHCLQADIVVAALGIPGFVKSTMVKEGAVIIDVGITRVIDTTTKKGYKIIGDVDFEEVSKKASAITPVPGGVGLMTIIGLLKNTLLAYKKQHLAN